MNGMEQGAHWLEGRQHEDTDGTPCAVGCQAYK